MLCRHYFEHVRRLERIGIEYWDCPQACGKQSEARRYDPRRVTFCDDCPRTRHKKRLFDETRRELSKWIGDEADNYALDKAYEMIGTAIISMRMKRRRRPVTIQAFIDIYESERSRDERVMRTKRADGGQ